MSTAAVQILYGFYVGKVVILGKLVWEFMCDVRTFQVVIVGTSWKVFIGLWGCMWGFINKYHLELHSTSRDMEQVIMMVHLLTDSFPFISIRIVIIDLFFSTIRCSYWW
jgi:hypothetical protein